MITVVSDYTHGKHTEMNDSVLLTDDKSMRVAQHSHSSPVDSCYGDPIPSPWFQGGDVQVVLAAVHCPVLVLLLLRLHTKHLEEQSVLKQPIGMCGRGSCLHSGGRAAYLVSLYETVVGFMRGRPPAQMDGVILLVAHCYGHSHWRGTGH